MESRPCAGSTRRRRVPDLVIIDLGLPRLDGYQVIQLINARPALECTRLVILSQRDDLLDRLKGQLVGTHAYLTMPFKTDRLLAVIWASLGAAVPSTEEARKHEKYKIVSSETTAHAHVSMGVFPPGQDGLLVNIANREQDRRRMEPLYGHIEEAQ